MSNDFILRLLLELIQLRRELIKYKQYSLELDRQLQGKQNATIQSERDG